MNRSNILMVVVILAVAFALGARHSQKWELVCYTDSSDREHSAIWLGRFATESDAREAGQSFQKHFTHGDYLIGKPGENGQLKDTRR